MNGATGGAENDNPSGVSDFPADLMETRENTEKSTVNDDSKRNCSASTGNNTNSAFRENVTGNSSVEKKLNTNMAVAKPNPSGFTSLMAGFLSTFKTCYGHKVKHYDTRDLGTKEDKTCNDVSNCEEKNKISVKSAQEKPMHPQNTDKGNRRNITSTVMLNTTENQECDIAPCEIEKGTVEWHVSQKECNEDTTMDKLGSQNEKIERIFCTQPRNNLLQNHTEAKTTLSENSGIDNQEDSSTLSAEIKIDSKKENNEDNEIHPQREGKMEINAKSAAETPLHAQHTDNRKGNQDNFTSVGMSRAIKNHERDNATCENKNETRERHVWQEEGNKDIKLESQSHSEKLEGMSCTQHIDISLQNQITETKTTLSGSSENQEDTSVLSTDVVEIKADSEIENNENNTDRIGQAIPKIGNEMHSQQEGKTNSKEQTEFYESPPEDPQRERTGNTTPNVQGIPNIGNTCYANSILQVLGHIPEFLRFLTEVTKQNGTMYCPISQSLLTLLKDIISDRRNSDIGSSVKMFLHQINEQNPTFEIGKQHDCHSFMLTLFGNIREEIGSETSVPFVGYSRNCFTCDQCQERSYSEQELFYSLLVPVPGGVLTFWRKTLKRGLKTLMKEDEVADLKCQSCQKKGKTNKKFEVTHYPKILILQINGIQQVKGTQKKKKTDKKTYCVQFVDSLSLPCINRGDEIHYELFGVVSHRGNLEGGHYFAYIKRENDWFCCNDERVMKQKSPAQQKKRGACLLFYCQQM